MNSKIVLIAALAVGLPLAAHADEQVAQNQSSVVRARVVEMKDQKPFQRLVEDAAEVYAAIAKGPHGEVPASVFQNARCIAVIPKVITGALVVGGTHGSGVASCRDSNRRWSQPAAISLTQGSIGIQAGAKSTDLVMFFQSQKAEQALKYGEFTIGTDVSAVAGNYDSSIDTSGAGVVVFTRTAGLFAGAAVSGGKIAKDQDDMALYYGKHVDYSALLDGRESPDSSDYTQRLTKLFP